MNTQKRNLSVVSQYRGALFGISIVSIMLFHFCNDMIKWRQHDALYKAASIYHDLIGSIGVEIFIFLSGVGLFYSFSKNPDVKSFYQKRLKRVLIPYLLWALFYWPIRDFPLTPRTVAKFLSDFSLLSFWLDGKRTYWFIAFIILAYAAFPLLYNILFSTIKGKQYSGWICSLVCIGWILFCCGLKVLFPAFYSNTEVAFSRFPIFVIGTWYGGKIKNNDKFGFTENILAISGLALIALHMAIKLHLLDVGFTIDNRFLPVPFSLFLVFFLSVMLDKLHSHRITHALTIVGNYSLELYMTHIGFRGFFMFSGVRTHRIVVFVAYILISVAFSLGLNKLNIKLQSS